MYTFTAIVFAHVVKDGCAYHFGTKTFGVRFATSSYNECISAKSVLMKGFEWIGKKNFGL